MNPRRPLRLFLFVYELVRLAVLIGVVAALRSALAESAPLPLLPFVSANCLFALMALFLFLDPLEYRPFLPLYVAGKLLFLSSAALWLGVSFAGIVGSFPMGSQGYLALLGGSALLLPLDLLALLAAYSLRPRTPPEERNADRNAEAPDFSVETVDSLPPTGGR